MRPPYRLAKTGLVEELFEQFVNYLESKELIFKEEKSVGII